MNKNVIHSQVNCTLQACELLWQKYTLQVKLVKRRKEELCSHFWQAWAHWLEQQQIISDSCGETGTRCSHIWWTLE